MGHEESMQLVQILSTVLALQHQAAATDAPVEGYIMHTQTILSAELLRLPRHIDPDIEELKVPPSAFDPPDHAAIKEGSRCKALYLEILRRAAHDWVLYRNSRKPERVHAHTAHVWLFEEKPGHPQYEARRQYEGGLMTAFLTICEVLDLDPEVVRARVRRMTRKDIERNGRPAEARKGSKDGVEDYVSPSQLDGIPMDDRHTTHYEEQFMVYTH